MEYEGVVKKWGNSYGIIVPKEVLQKQGLKENAKVLVLLAQPGKVLKKTFGMFKHLKLTGQEAKMIFKKELYA